MMRLAQIPVVIRGLCLLCRGVFCFACVCRPGELFSVLCTSCNEPRIPGLNVQHRTLDDRGSDTNIQMAISRTLAKWATKHTYDNDKIYTTQRP
ncbi:hypothetical protein BDZ94DRAFT_1271537 [Collybia nuda]|uniref:Secreted protein n=1 Tax=Collybia nuda TaxID=64659 RepID=A0A9P6CEK9_9AGAR|nr:hypothetical protein BDZ94DRAFT_1271537 [Collybia nuda]